MMLKLPVSDRGYALRPALLAMATFVALIAAVGLLAFASPKAATQDQEVLNMTTQETGPVTFRELTPEEERVIVHKGTERPFTGEYNKFYEAGTYHCRRCDAPLYESDSKFDSGCGWPSFDDEIDGAVKRLPDPDGRRTEIVCARCDAHLGHVFLGEGFTPKDTRHCVNSISMIFKPAGDKSANKEVKTKRAVFAAGCFWGVEYYFKKEPGVVATAVGYSGGHVKNPTYRQVCTTETGHAEAVEVFYDPSKTNYETLAKLFFEIHDPTQVNRQGPDVGRQYRSVAFYSDQEERAILENLVGQLRAKGLDVATEIEAFKVFYREQEDYHHDYYTKTGKQPYCHFRTKRFD
jgi:peptide methionine sulfoxide reductase msrA/msrB